MPPIDAPTVILCLSIVVAVIGVALVWCLRVLFRLRTEVAMQRELVDSEGKRRVNQSRAVLLGQVAEHFAPLLPGFDYNPKDARFLGQPVDYLVFNGLNNAETTLEIVFCEIKTGGSHLSPSERAIKAAVEAGRVRFEIIRIEPDGALRRS